MNASSYFQIAKSGLFASVLTLALASCSKENVQPSTSTSSSTSIKQNESLMPMIDRRIVREDELDMKQVGLNDQVSTNDIIADPAQDDRFKQIGNDDDVSTASANRPGRGTPDVTRFKQIAPKTQISTDAKPGRDHSKFRSIRMKKDFSTN